MQGFVYILRNACLPGLLKIGKTSRTPMDRCKELFTSGLPSPFEIVFAVYSDDASILEKLVHDELVECKVNPSREFFKIEECEAIKHVLDYSIGDRGLVTVDEPMAVSDLAIVKFVEATNEHPFHINCAIREFLPEEWVSVSKRSKEKYAGNGATNG